MANHAPSVSAPRHYLFRVVSPSTANSLTIATETPSKALSLFGAWFKLPTSELAITRRSPVQEVRS